MCTFPICENSLMVHNYSEHQNFMIRKHTIVHDYSDIPWIQSWHHRKKRTCSTCHKSIDKQYHKWKWNVSLFVLTCTHCGFFHNATNLDVILIASWKPEVFATILAWPTFTMVTTYMIVETGFALKLLGTPRFCTFMFYGRFMNFTSV